MAAERVPVGQIVGRFKTAVVISCKLGGGRSSVRVSRLPCKQPPHLEGRGTLIYSGIRAFVC